MTLTKLVSVLVLFTLTKGLVSQNSVPQNKIDSLQQLIKVSSNDTAKINLLNKLAIEFSRTDIEKYKHYSQVADSLSTVKNYTMGKAESLRNLGVYYMRKSDFGNAFSHLNLAFAKYKQLNDYNGMANCLLTIGATYNQMSKYDSALINYQKSLELWVKAKNINKERIAATYNNIGLVYRKQGNLPMALEYYQKSLAYKEEINDKAGAGDTYNNIGVIYRMLNDYSRAIYNYKKSLVIRKEIGFQRGVAANFGNIAISYFEDKQLDSSLKYANESLKLNIELNEKRSIAYSYNILGDIFLRKNELKLAYDYYEKGFKQAEETQNQAVKISTTIGLGEVKFKQSDFQRALFYGKQAYFWANNVGDISMIKLSSKLIADANAALGKYKEAYEFHVLYKSLSDTIQNEVNTRKIIGLEYEFKYQKDKVENEKIQLKQQAKLSKQKQITLTFFIGFCLVLLLVFLVFSNLKRKQKDYRIISTQKDEIEQRNKLLNAQKEEIQTQNELLVNQAKMLAELDEVKSRFFANISHELRTPLTLILSPLSKIIDTGKHDKDTFNVMLRNAKKLQSMIDDLLDLARMEKGAIDIQLEEANINELVKGVVNSFEGVANEKKLTIETEGLETACNLHFDRAGIEKVISNLLSNAIKFTPAGKRIKIASSHSAEYFSLRVSDEGIGIPKGETEKIFNRFFRASNSQMVTGTGIGLSLVNDIVTLHGGSVEAKKSDLGGAEFLVKIPFKRRSISEELDDDETNIDTITSADPAAIPHKKTLLVVEDNFDLRSFLVSSLNETYNVLDAENGEMGLQIASTEHVDIIISDVMMPIMDGYTLTKTIRSSSELCHIPIVLLTAKSSEQSVIKGLESEADAYITKPFSLTHLKAVLSSQLRIRQKLHKKFQKEISVNPSEVTTTSMDEQFITKATRIVEENLSNETYSIDDFCCDLTMSRTSVHRKITAITGLSTSDFIRTIRLKRAAQLVKGRVASISEISFMVGFSDVSYFTKCFKKEFGVTPTEFQS